MIQPSLVPLLIVGSKYDIFQVSAREIWRGNKANTHTHSFSHTLTHTRTHARTHAHTHTHTHTHAFLFPLPSSLFHLPSSNRTLILSGEK